MRESMALMSLGANWSGFPDNYPLFLFFLGASGVHESELWTTAWDKEYLHTFVRLTNILALSWR